MTPPATPDERRFNEKLDDLQAAHPFLYNLGTGAIIGVVLSLFGFQWLFAVAYALVWASLRAFLWGDGRVLRRQYDARKVRSDEAKVARRRRT
ncbi:MAG: hypothetical protein ACSLFP_10095 [Acidimicrobiales bacterium]